MTFTWRRLDGSVGLETADGSRREEHVEAIEVQGVAVGRIEWFG